MLVLHLDCMLVMIIPVSTDFCKKKCKMWEIVIFTTFCEKGNLGGPGARMVIKQIGFHDVWMQFSLKGRKSTKSAKMSGKV